MKTKHSSLTGTAIQGKIEALTPQYLSMIKTVKGLVVALERRNRKVHILEAHKGKWEDCYFWGCLVNRNWLNAWRKAQGL